MAVDCRARGVSCLASNNLELADDTVDVWLTNMAEVPASAIAGYTRLMSSAERARNLRYRGEALRRADTIARAVLRTVLSHYGDWPPSLWEFAQADHGKPYIIGPAAQLYFNLSHSSEWVACAVARFPSVGIDIERTSRNPEILRLAKRFFAPPEYADVRARAGAARKERFFDYWTLKEAYIKARGEGISLGLDRFGFRIGESGDIAIACDDQLHDDPGAWCFRLSAGEGDHRLALAMKPHPSARPITLRHFITIPQRGTQDYTGPLLLGGAR